jgi:hypothetical protein
MLFRAQNAQVAVIGPDNKVQLRAINIGRDYGTTLEILGGVAASDRIVVNPPDSLEDGEQVNVAQPQQNQGAQGQPSQGQPGGQNTNQQKGSTK